MENKVVCYYCGTAYDAQEEKCPLCGGKAVAREEEVFRPVQRQRITEQERRQRRRQASKTGKFAANKNEKDEKPARSKDSTKAMLIAALIFLSLAVIVVTWFIGDMIGWWGGVEDSVDRGNAAAQQASEGAAMLENEECTKLEISASSLTLSEVGQTAELKLMVNESCKKYIKITFPNAAVVTAVSGGDTEFVNDDKVDTWVITAVSEGTTQMAFEYGDMKAVCDIVVGKQAEQNDPKPSESDDDDDEPVEPDEDYEPRLNFASDVSFYERGESVPLRVINLPNGTKVSWKSDDITIAKIDENGILTAVGYGKTKVTADISGQKIELLVRCAFSDNAADDITFGAHLTHNDVTIGVGNSFNLYLIDDDGERISDAVYTISDDEICDIDDGTVTGRVGGDYAVVTVTYNQTEYKCTVRVRW